MREVDEILKAEVVGSFLFDQELWNRCDQFILNPDNSMEDKIKVYDKISDIVGETTPGTEADVLHHIKVLTEDGIRFEGSIK